MTNPQTLIHNFAFEVQEGLSDDQIGDKSVELLNEILDLVEKEVELNELNIVVNEFNEVGITTRKLKTIINTLRVK